MVATPEHSRDRFGGFLKVLPQAAVRTEETLTGVHDSRLGGDPVLEDLGCGCVGQVFIGGEELGYQPRSSVSVVQHKVHVCSSLACICAVIVEGIHKLATHEVYLTSYIEDCKAHPGSWSVPQCSQRLLTPAVCLGPTVATTGPAMQQPLVCKNSPREVLEAIVVCVCVVVQQEHVFRQGRLKDIAVDAHVDAPGCSTLQLRHQHSTFFVPVLLLPTCATGALCPLGASGM